MGHDEGQEYKLSDEDYRTLMETNTDARPMNDFWATMGEKMGFVHPGGGPIPGKTSQFFTAVPTEPASVKIQKAWEAVPDTALARIAAGERELRATARLLFEARAKIEDLRTELHARAQAAEQMANERDAANSRRDEFAKRNEQLQEQIRRQQATIYNLQYVLREVAAGVPALIRERDNLQDLVVTVAFECEGTENKFRPDTAAQLNAALNDARSTEKVREPGYATSLWQASLALVAMIPEEAEVARKEAGQS